ncbi:MAG: hypothetical protein O2897_04430, partial [bacterium]|nr:hypothetical protein [bacterium]
QYKIDDNLEPHTVLLWPLSDAEKVFDQDFFNSQPMDLLGSNPNDWLLVNKAYLPLISLSDALLYKKEIALGNAINSNIFISFNLAPLHHKNNFSSVSHYEYEFFNEYHKYPSDILIIASRDYQNIKFVLLDSNDVDQWQEFLRQDDSDANHNINPKREVHVGLYNLNLGENGLYQEGKNSFDVAKLTKNKQFLEMLAQVKFFAGNVDYSAEELPYLKYFLKGPSPEVDKQYEYSKKMKAIFEHQIIRIRADSIQNYRGSDLEATFKSLLGEI